MTVMKAKKKWIVCLVFALTLLMAMSASAKTVSKKSKPKVKTTYYVVNLSKHSSGLPTYIKSVRITSKRMTMRAVMSSGPSMRAAWTNNYYGKKNKLKTYKFKFAKTVYRYSSSDDGEGGWYKQKLTRANILSLRPAIYPLNGLSMTLKVKGNTIQKIWFTC